MNRVHIDFCHYCKTIDLISYRIAHLHTPESINLSKFLSREVRKLVQCLRVCHLPLLVKVKAYIVSITDKIKVTDPVEELIVPLYLKLLFKPKVQSKFLLSSYGFILTHYFPG